MIFLDTDVLSYYFAGNIIIRDKIFDCINEGEKICLTTINIYEVKKGLKYRHNPQKEKQFNAFLENVFIYTLDNLAIEEASDIYADLRKGGIQIGDADILIAAIVISNNGALASNNIRHYKNIRALRLIDWI